MQEVMKTSELAEWLRVKPQTINKWKSEGLIPSLRLTSRCIRFDPDAVLAALTGKHPAAETAEADTSK
ncbi:MAG: helix-turn-helix domain-containing protein [Planctomycetota bacterium]|nr:helix-turn-helix domain-containing protein [Planctomycetota bacterium]